MSLTVFLDGDPEPERPCPECSDCWNCGGKRVVRFTPSIYDANITHNLGGMADAVGIYQHLWRPDELGITKAKELIAPLRDGLAKLKADPERFKKFDADNGWGRYIDFVPWLEHYLAACEAHPDANVRVSR
jgi:hypothetical protein